MSEGDHRPIPAIGYHVAIVVHDVEASARRYQELVGGPFKTFTYDQPASRISERPWPAARLLLAYGRFGGMTIELIQSLDDEGLYASFLRTHGEAVHHLGFWVPDVHDALEVALVEGAPLTTGRITAPGDDPVRLDGLRPTEVCALLAGPVAFVDPGTGPQLELVGTPDGLSALATLLGDDLERIVDLPPWEV